MKNLKNQIGTSLLVIAAVILLGGCATVVKPGYLGIKNHPLGRGLATEKIYDNGIVWKIPWDGVKKYSVQWQTFPEMIAILTQDELHTTITVSAILRPISKELGPLALEIGDDYYNKVVKPEFFTVTRSTFAKYKYMELSQKSTEIEKEIITELQSRIAGKHLELNAVTINHIEYSKVVTDATDMKLATKQKIEQKDYEIKIAEKDAQIQTTLARGQRDAQQIIDDGLSTKYLQFKALQVQEKLAASPNAKFFFVPLGKDGVPIILDTNEPTKNLSAINGGN
ncbi:MAG TPA: prohibitin family protein [Bacteroidia bacterium]|nr:prohibitin family protein [Bacteroidia bacterium]